MIRKLLPVLALALLASGCFEADLLLEVEEDGSGTFTTELAVDAARLELLFGGLSASMGTDEEIDACSLLEEPDSITEGGTSEPFRRDDLCGFRSVEPFSSPEELLAVLDGTFSDDTGVPDAQAVTLAPDGEGWTFELALPNEGILAEMTPQLAETLGFDDSVLTFRLVLPGRVVEHNGTRIEDGAVVWDIDIANPPAEPLRARSEPGEPIENEGDGASEDGDGGGGAGAVIVVVGVVAVILVAAFVLLRRRSTPTA